MSSLSTFLWVISVFIHVIPVVLTKKIHFHPSSEFVSNCKHGDFVILKYDRYIGRSLREYGEWSDGELSEIYSHYVKQRSVVLDVGANIGAFTVPLGKLAGPYGVVHAFEPLRTVHNLMVTNTVLNGLINVVPHLAFVGEQKSKAPVISRPTQEELMKKAPHIQYTIPNNYGRQQWTEESLEEREGTCLRVNDGICPCIITLKLFKSITLSPQQPQPLQLLYLLFPPYFPIVLLYTSSLPMRVYP